MLLTEDEATVLEAFRVNGNQCIRDVSAVVGRHEKDVSKIVQQLRAKDALAMVNKRGMYRVLIEAYEIGEMPVEAPTQDINPPIDVDTSAIPGEMRDYIQAHAPYLRRSVLVKRTGIPKLKLNQLLIELKEGKQHA